MIKELKTYVIECDKCEQFVHEKEFNKRSIKLPLGWGYFKFGTFHSYVKLICVRCIPTPEEMKNLNIKKLNDYSEED
jgi:hypothetical protein